MLMRLKRPHRRCGAFFLPNVSSLRGRCPEPRGVACRARGRGEPAEPHLGAGPEQRGGTYGQRSLAGSLTSGRAGPELTKGGATRGQGRGTAHCAADPTPREPGEGGTAKPYPRAGSLPRQAQQQPSSESSRPRSRASSAPAPITPLRWLVSVGGTGSARCQQPPRPRRVAPSHSPRRQAPVTGSQESSWQLQAWAQSTPWSPGGHVRLQLRGCEIKGMGMLCSPR